MKKVLLILFIVIVGGIAFLPSPATAGIVPCDLTGTNRCQLCDIFQLVDNIFIFFLIPNEEINNNVPLVPIVATLMIVIGGFMYIFAYASPTGGPEWISRAKRLFASVIFGLIIAYGAWLLIDVFFSFFITETGPFQVLRQGWSNIDWCSST